MIDRDKARYLIRAARETMRELPRDLRFRRKVRAAGGTLPPLPPPYLRFRVAGTYDASVFHDSGWQSRLALECALDAAGRKLASFRRILDFGAGCSRILRWMGDLGPAAELHGTDIDRIAIRWSRRNIPWARFGVNEGLPPFPYPDAFFDLVWGNSVFTHLDETYQDAWLRELRRVTTPGGVVLLTVNGRKPWDGFVSSAPGNPAMQTYQETFERQGFLYVSNDSWTGIFPSFYHSMFHRKEYVLDHWSQFLEPLDYREQAMLDFQDLVVLRNRFPAGESVAGSA